MILVDVFVPSVDKTYNFSLNESVEIGLIITEITEMIEKTERTTFAGDKGALCLYDRKTQSQLSPKNTLYDYYMTTGSQLMLI